MRKYLVDKEGDIWTEAKDGTLVCIADGVTDAIEKGDGESLGFVTKSYGPLIPLAPDDGKCYDQLAPGIVCDREKHDLDPAHRAIGPHGSTVVWS
jgi:hypothetical protein